MEDFLERCFIFYVVYLQNLNLLFACPQELSKKINLFFAGKRKNPNALLEQAKPKALDLCAKYISNKIGDF